MSYLSPVEWLFRCLVACRNFMYQHGLMPVKRLPGKVISVGNIAIGGTGKSPLVMDFAKRLLQAGARPVILTRGYKSGLREGEWQVLRNGQVFAGVSRSEVKADEAMMQSMAAPEIFVVVGSNRYDAAQHFLKLVTGWNPTHWILDDGFQHRQIHRDCDIVVIDVRRPWGPCLPVGRFREPRSALKRASWVVLTKSVSNERSDEVSNQIRKINRNCLVYETNFIQAPLRSVCGDASSSDGDCALVCSIANPEDVVGALKAKGVRIDAVFAFADHSRIDPLKISKSGKSFNRIVTTEKDWARDRQTLESLGLPIFIAPLAIEWRGFEPELSTI